MSSVTKNLYCSAAGAAVAELSTLPICTAKTIYQLNNRITIFEAFGKISLENAFRASPMAVGSQVLSSSLKISMYNTTRDKIENNYIRGAFTSLVVSAGTHPLEYYKINFQNGSIKSFLDGIKFIPKVYQGYSKSAAKYFVGGFLYLPIFDLVKKHSDSPFIAGVASAIISTSILQPLDYLKVVHIGNNEKLSLGIIKKAYRGLSLNLMRVVPHFTIMMMATSKLLEIA